MFIMDYKSTYKCPWRYAKSLPLKTNVNFTATCASAYIFSKGIDVLEATNYVIDERPKRVALRLVQLCDDFDKEVLSHGCRVSHILSLLLSLLSWLIWA